ncbi:MarR family transcriptional regulator [Curtobacterium sp. MCPF17_003]|uniref:MarR family winged helix-turn-helix transcriptional regulator n=1 Tax=Curtobacterium sp. MCPF17_003 TaxID=2175637 RepID=UPI000D8089E0|nr:MarR family transcriptional regulator [Curtobacterium sp. MCPF17_003]PYY65160.1 MarR family transcriptional regulator [Curtobacterium sp. MCPF17_003]
MPGHIPHISCEEERLRTMSTPEERELPELLARVSFEVMGRLAKLSAEEDMSLTLLPMLAILRDRRLRMAELAAALGTDRSSTSGLIARAERRGLVEREPAANDKRGFTVALSQRGHTFAAEVEERTFAALAPLLNNVPAADRDRLSVLLGSVVEA